MPAYARSVRLSNPQGVAALPGGGFLIADTGDNVVALVTRRRPAQRGGGDRDARQRRRRRPRAGGRAERADPRRADRGRRLPDSRPRQRGRAPGVAHRHDRHRAREPDLDHPPVRPGTEPRRARPGSAGQRLRHRRPPGPPRRARRRRHPDRGHRRVRQRRRRRPRRRRDCWPSPRVSRSRRRATCWWPTSTTGDRRSATCAACPPPTDRSPRWPARATTRSACIGAGGSPSGALWPIFYITAPRSARAGRAITIRYSTTRGGIGPRVAAEEGQARPRQAAVRAARGQLGDAGGREEGHLHDAHHGRRATCPTTTRTRAGPFACPSATTPPCRSSAEARDGAGGRQRGGTRGQGPAKRLSHLRRAFAMSGTMLTALIALASAGLALFFQLRPDLTPDPRTHLGASASIFAVDDGVTLGSFLERRRAIVSEEEYAKEKQAYIRQASRRRRRDGTGPHAARRGRLRQRHHRRASSRGRWPCWPRCTTPTGARACAS